ncbi:MAG: hypothetical protein OXC66_12065, partial [Roseovarius sp.]|nr:hypothetical protein [Roseovarius sp.]
KLVAVKRYSENRIRTGNPKILQINPSVMGNMLKMGRHELAARARRPERPIFLSISRQPAGRATWMRRNAPLKLGFGAPACET